MRPATGLRNVVVWARFSRIDCSKALTRPMMSRVRAMAVWALIRLDPPQALTLAGGALAMEKDPDVRREWLALTPATDAAS